MNIGALKQFFYALWLTNSYGVKLKKAQSDEERGNLRLAYSKAQLKALNIEVAVEGKEHLEGLDQVLLISNHRTIIDPPIIEVALEKSNLFGLWVAKKELYNSIFFGAFVRNAGTLLLDRESGNMKPFFKEVTKQTKVGRSIYIFPEGTRNKTDEMLIPFKSGAKLIARQNKLPILPVWIDPAISSLYSKAVGDASKKRQIHVKVGRPIPYDTKEDLRQLYKAAFDL